MSSAYLCAFNAVGLIDQGSIAIIQAEEKRLLNQALSSYLGMMPPFNAILSSMMALKNYSDASISYQNGNRSYWNLFLRASGIKDSLVETKLSVDQMYSDRDVVFYSSSTWQERIMPAYRITSFSMDLGNLVAGGFFGAKSYLKGKYSFIKGDFPVYSSGERVLLRPSPGMGYATYDAERAAISRADLEGSAHAGIKPPHIHYAKWNIMPNGEPRFGGWGKKLGKDFSAMNKIQGLIMKGIINFLQ